MRRMRATKPKPFKVIERGHHVQGGGRSARRRATLPTVIACHLPPLALGTLRFNSAAIAVCDIPRCANSANVGRTVSANVAAFAFLARLRGVAEPHAASGSQGGFRPLADQPGLQLGYASGDDRRPF
jgi:hypothetical protein